MPLLPSPSVTELALFASQRPKLQPVPRKEAPCGPRTARASSLQGGSAGPRGIEGAGRQTQQPLKNCTQTSAFFHQGFFSGFFFFFFCWEVLCLQRAAELRGLLLRSEGPQNVGDLCGLELRVLKTKSLELPASGVVCDIDIDKAGAFARARMEGLGASGTVLRHYALGLRAFSLYSSTRGRCFSLLSALRLDGSCFGYGVSQAGLKA